MQNQNISRSFLRGLLNQAKITSGASECDFDEEEVINNLHNSFNNGSLDISNIRKSMEREKSATLNRLRQNLKKKEEEAKINENLKKFQPNSDELEEELQEMDFSDIPSEKKTKGQKRREARKRAKEREKNMEQNM